MDMTTHMHTEQMIPTTLRPPRADEVDAVLALFDDEVRAGRMLPRDPTSVRSGLDDWIVAEDGEGRLVGCVSLVFFNADLAEVRSLAVHPDRRGNGLGAALVVTALELAQQRGVRHVLTLTRAAALFERLGFRRDFVTSFPEKVWRDCAPCPLKERCDEMALVYFIEEGRLGNGNGSEEHPAG
jgi:N-acetylglutamate synthase-like GNAT family acetyltransferase